MLSDVRRRLPFASRTEGTELLDAGALSQSEVEANLADLARLNRLPGGTATSMRAIEAVMGRGNDIRILDVGTGAADMPIAFARRGWSVVGIDPNPEVLAVARRRAARQPGVTIVEGDVGGLPFEDGAFDVAHASLLLHHLAPEAAVAALEELRRVSRHGIVVNDLRRGALTMAVTLVSLAALARSRVTRSDGMMSVRRAYTVSELDRMTAAAGLTTRWRSAAWMPRVVTGAVAT
jgi:ubiquinone/menaquinone biosynthesis C-methylase UbiE